MKNLIISLTFLLTITSVYCQAPNKISYQAVVRDGNNNLITNSSIGMKISIISNSIDGAIIYEEIQNTDSNDNGLVSIDIGGGEVELGNFPLITWENGPYFLKTEIDISGGSNYTITGTTELLSVPFALHAKTAERLTENPESFYLGQDTLGGIIFYLYKGANGEQHGFIVSKTEIYAGITEPYTGLTWNGAQTYVNGLGDDWRLPTYDELKLLFDNSFHANSGLSLGGYTLLSYGNYWSSSIGYWNTSEYLTYDHSENQPEAYEASAIWVTTRAIKSF